MNKMIIIWGIFLLLTGNIFGQFNGDWYSIRTRGLSKISLSDNKVESTHLDNISDTSSYTITHQIIKKVIKSNSIYLLHQMVIEDQLVENPNFEKFKFDAVCNCLYSGFIDIIIDSVPTPETLEQVVQNDNSQNHLVTFYRDSTIKSFYKMKDVKNATADELVKIHQIMLNSYQETVRLVKERGTSISPFGPLALLRGNIKSETFIKNGFSPFFKKTDYMEVMEKYKDNEQLQAIKKQLNE